MDPRGLRSAPNNRNRFHLNDASSLLVMCLLWCSVYRPTYTIYRSSSSLNVCSKACLYKAAFLKQKPKGNQDGKKTHLYTCLRLVALPDSNDSVIAV